MDLSYVAVMIYVVLGQPLAYVAGLIVVMVGLVELPSKMSSYWTNRNLSSVEG